MGRFFISFSSTPNLSSKCFWSIEIKPAILVPEVQVTPRTEVMIVITFLGFRGAY
jgi:hypothetical protein